MQNRIFTLILVVIIGVLVGVGVVTKQVREPLLRELLRQQGVLAQAVARVEKALGQEDKDDNQNGGDLADRVAVLERQVKGLQNLIQQAGGGAGQIPPQAPPVEDLSKVYDIPLDHSPVRGPKNAPVTIVEFMDFQCPFCARFHAPIMETLKAYPDKVNYIVKNYPLSFHPQAKPAAKAALAAGEQGKYWEMTDALLENGNALSEQKFEELAGKLGLDVKRFMNDYRTKDAQWEGYIQKDISLANNVDVRGTPTFYINGKKTNARDINGFKQEVDKILKNKK
jgi:protein-disulfide isomerase